MAKKRKKSRISASLITSAIQNLKKAGIDARDIRALITNPGMCRRIVEYWKRETNTPMPTFKSVGHY